MRFHTTLPFLAAVAATFTVAACHDAAGPVDGATPLFKKGGHGGPPAPGAFSTIATFRDAVTDNIRSDAELRSDPDYSGPDYEDGTCGVMADLGNLDDARMDPDMNYRRKDARHCGDPRVLIIDRRDPADGGPAKAQIIEGVFSNIDSVLSVGDGQTVLREGQFNTCGGLHFDGTNGSDLLQVTFDASNDEWTVTTQPNGNDKGYCEGDGRVFHLPFEMTIRRQ